MENVLEYNAESSNREGRPMRLVYYDDENGEFKMNPHAIDVLDQIKGPLAVISVCGPCQGKSFILNQLLGRTAGSQVASTHQPCTEGLWMWSLPLKRTTLDGTEYDLLLLDSGGVNAYDNIGMYSTQIFSLAVLLSSLFVYNQVGVIDEAALDHISLVTEMAKHIHGRAFEGKESVSELGHFSPVFIWLLRDFYLDLMEDDIKITPPEYLEHALKPVLGSEKDIAAKNQIRESIRAVFPNRECFTLVRPLNNEIDLQHLDQIALDKFRPEFRSGLDAFAKFVYERTRPKQLGSMVMTGPFLVGITKSFLDVLNNGVVPTSSSSWQYYTKDACMEADLSCSNAVRNMEEKLQGACLIAGARIENVVMVLENLLSEYEASVHGPTKWQKLSSFLVKSLRGPILEHAMKLIEEISVDKSSLMLKCHSIGHKIESLQQQLQASEKLKAEYQKNYESAINDFKKLADHYKSRIIDMESKCSLLEERCSSLLEMMDSAKQESLEWERKYEEILTKKGAVIDLDIAKTAVLKSGIREAETRSAAATEQSRLAWKEANEWRENYAIAVNEAKAVEKAAEQAKLREEALIANFTYSLAEKDEEIKDKSTKLEEAEQKLTTLTLDLKVAEMKMENYDLESSAFKLQVRELTEKYEFVKATAQSMEREVQTLINDKIQLEQKCISELKKFEEAHERCKVAEEKVKFANELIETAKSVVLTAQNEKHDTQQLTLDKLAQTRSPHSHIEILDGVKMYFAGEAEKFTSSQSYAMSKVTFLEAMVRERDQKIDMLKKKCEQYVSSVQILESAHAEANRMKKTPSLKLEPMQEILNLSQQKKSPDHPNESATDSGLQTYAGEKRSRLEFSDVSFYSAPLKTDEEVDWEMKRPMSSSPLQLCTSKETDSVLNINDEENEYQNSASADYTKLTVAKLRQELNDHGFVNELQKLKYPKKKDILALYRKLVLKN